MIQHEAYRRSLGLADDEKSYEWIDDDLTHNFTLAGKHVYLIGREDGSFSGRWNGVWSLPIKMLDAIRFGVSFDANKILWLNNFCEKFITRVSHIERIYNFPNFPLSLNELLFIPDDVKAVCWCFKFKNNSRGDLSLKFAVNPLLNLMWEVKQAGELWKERRELLFYDENNSSIIARHNRKSDWVTVLGADRKPEAYCLGLDEVDNTLPNNNILPSPNKPNYGNVLLTYPINIGPGECYSLNFALCGGVSTLSQKLEIYRRIIGNFKSQLTEKNRVYEHYLRYTVGIEHPLDEVMWSFLWSKVNLQMLKHYQEGFGLGYFAGLPHFPIFFGRDTAWASLGATAIGDFETVKESLLLLARFQAGEDGEDGFREPFFRGEIPHEIRTEGTVYYYSVDATPLFVMAVHNYFKWSKDDVFLRFIYNNVVKALDWCINADRDKDGLMEHGPEGFLPDVTWMDSLYRGKSAVDVQAIFCKALTCGAKIAEHLDDTDRAKEWRNKAEKLKNALIEHYWNAEDEFFYDTILPDGTPSKAHTINAVIPAFLKLISHDKALPVLSRIESQDFMTEWGVRTRSKSDPEYDGRSYQKGGVWPFCTGWVAGAEFSYGRYMEGLNCIFRTVKGLEYGANYFKEVLYGDIPPSGITPIHPSGCFIQAWSASIFLQSVVQWLLGIEPNENGYRIKVAPFLLPEWKKLRAKNIRFGGNILTFELTRNLNEIEEKIINFGERTVETEIGFIAPATIQNISAFEECKLLEATNAYHNDLYSIVTSNVTIRPDERKRVIFKLRGS